MKKTIYCICVYISLFLISCSDDIKESIISHDEPRNEIGLVFSEEELVVLKGLAYGTHTLKEEQAAEIALSIFSDSKNGHNKSALSRMIKNVDIITGKKERANKSFNEDSELDTLMYVFNFENNAGFSVVSADIRVNQPILAYSPSGEIDKEDDILIEEEFFDLAKLYIEEQVKEAEVKHDSILNAVTQKIESFYGDSIQFGNTKAIGNKAATIVQKILLTNQCTSTYTYTNTANVDPLIKTAWSQKGSYNDKVSLRYQKDYNAPTSYCDRIPVGCVAVAVGQIMAYWQYPNSLYGYDGPIYMNWKEIRNTDLSDYTNANIKEQIQYLLSYVGKGVNMDYHHSGSSSNIEYARDYLNSIGYKAKMFSYTYDGVVSELNKKRPVYIRGVDIGPKNGGGHAWVIDGYTENNIHREDRLTYVCITTNTINYGEPPLFIHETSSSNTKACYLHNNWGWGNPCNGYYLKDVFVCSEQYIKDDATFKKIEDVYSYNYMEEIQYDFGSNNIILTINK